MALGRLLAVLIPDLILLCGFQPRLLKRVTLGLGPRGELRVFKVKACVELVDLGFYVLLHGVTSTRHRVKLRQYGIPSLHESFLDMKELSLQFVTIWARTQ